jgi:hypothetical protein
MISDISPQVAAKPITSGSVRNRARTRIIIERDLGSSAVRRRPARATAFNLLRRVEPESFISVVLAAAFSPLCST